MAKDVFIIPSEGLVQFSSSAGSGSGKIQSDGDDIVISNALGDVLLGDGTADVFIGDGTNNVDIVFEQNGEIKDDGSGKNIIFGSKTTNVFISGSNTVALQSGGGNVGIGTTTAGKTLEVVGDISASGTISALQYGGNVSGSSTSTGSFGNIVGNSISLPNNSISGDVVEGGTIASITISQLGGALNVNNQNITNIDVNSGAIDGTTIGAASATTIKGTTIDATTDFTIGGTVITDNKIADDGTFQIDAAADITLDAAGKDINMTDGSGTAEFIFNLEDAPELDVDGNFTIDGSGLIKLDSATNIVDLVGNVTASNNISSSGTITMLTASIGGGIFTSASLAGGGGGAVSAVANGSNNRVATFSSGDALNGEANLLFNGSLLEVGGKLKVSSHITASGNISGSSTSTITVGGDVNIVKDKLKIGGTAVTTTAGELNFLDTAAANSVVNSKAVIYGSSGELAGTLSTAAQTNITSVGALAGGSISSDFGAINNGASAITTTGTVSAGRVNTTGGVHVGGTADPGTDNLIVDGTTILTGNVTASGDISASGTIAAANVDVLDNNAGNNPRLRVGRADGQHIEINVIDNDNTIKAEQDSDSNGEHNFILTREFDGTGANNFKIQKGTSDELIVDTGGNVSIQTGSLNLVGQAGGHITASGNISASGNLDVTGNANIDGDLDLAGKSSFTGNITASANISASGKVITEQVGDGNANLLLRADNITLQTDASGDITFKEGTNTKFKYDGGEDGFTFTGNITASNNISASGDVDANRFLVNGKRAIEESSDELTLGFGVGNGLINLGRTSAAPQIFASGHITASGNISASGNYIGNRQFNKTSNTDADHQGDVVFFGGTTSMDAGKIYAYGNDGAWNLSDADHNNLSGSGLLGVALGAASDTNGMLLRGTVTLDHDPGAVGDVLYLSTTAGRATSTVPSGNTDIARVVGYCLDASNGQIWFNPDNTFVEVSA